MHGQQCLWQLCMSGRAQQGGGIQPPAEPYHHPLEAAGWPCKLLDDFGKIGHLRIVVGNESY